MVDISNKRLDELKKGFDGKRIAVIGDMMLDGYFWGDVKRISLKLRAPVLDVEDEFFRFGGAANVALNVLTLGGIPVPVGVIGNDTYGNIFLRYLKKRKLIRMEL